MDGTAVDLALGLCYKEGTLIIITLVVRVTSWMVHFTDRGLHFLMQARSGQKRPGVWRHMLLILALGSLLCVSVPRVAMGNSPRDRAGGCPFGSHLFIQQTILPRAEDSDDPAPTPSDDLSVQLNCPSFLRSGDSFLPRVVLYNHLDSELQVGSTLTAEGLTIEGSRSQYVSIPAEAETVLTWEAITDEAPTAHLVVRIKGENGEVSEEVSLPILPSGAQQRVEQRGRVWVREWLISHLNHRATQLNSLILISPSMLAMLLKDYAQWEGIPYKNNDQAANLLLVTTALWKAFTQAGAQDIPEAQPVRTGLIRAAQYLMEQQNTDGGWGWWTGDDSRLLQTAQVLHALFEAEATGLVDIPTVKETMGLEAVRSYWVSEEDQDLRAYLLYVISQRRFDDKGLSTHELWWDRRRLSTPALAYLGMALDNMNALSPHRKADVLASLKRRASQTEHFVWWPAPEGRGDLPGGDRYGTAVALQVFLRWSDSEELVGRSFDWLLRTGTSPTERIDFATAQSIVTLAQAKRSQEPLSEGVVRVALEGVPVFEEKANNQDLLKVHEISLQDLQPGSNWIEILLEWPGPLYFDWTLQYILADGELDEAHSSGGIILKRQHFKPEVEEPSQKYETGKFILVRLEAETEEDLYHVVIEDSLPAGCRPVMGSLKGEGLEHSGLETSMHGDQVRFFLPELPKGNHTFTYLLRAETPGRFLSMPARAYLAHNTSRWGQSAGEEIEISVVTTD